MQVNKVWGHEEIVTNNDKYCMKMLFLRDGYQSSMHYHKVKDETFLVISGRVKLEVMPYFKSSPDYADVVHTIRLKQGASYRLEPMTPHRFTSIDGDAVIVEASTPHSDEDVVRLEESKAIG